MDTSILAKYYGWKVSRKPGAIQTANAILLDFLARLEGHNSAVNRFQTAPYREWVSSRFAWIGLYEWLQSEHATEAFAWQYVANQRGGFLGAWWHFRDWNGSSVYLQIEEGNLCFKIGTEDQDRARRPELRDAWATTLLARARGRGVKLFSPRRGVGKYMTVAALSVDAWMARDARDVLDKAATLSNLSKAASLIDEAAAQAGAASLM